MLKLYKIAPGDARYWETWNNDDGTHTVHWGRLGDKGQSKTVKSSLFKKAEVAIQSEIDQLVADGYAPVDSEDHRVLLIEYEVEGFGNDADLSKRHRLEERMNETLGWTGLGACDGGSIGSGTMEVCCFVVDFQTAKEIVAKDLENTEFSNYIRIYDEGADYS